MNYVIANGKQVGTNLPGSVEGISSRAKIAATQRGGGAQWRGGGAIWNFPAAN